MRIGEIMGMLLCRILTFSVLFGAVVNFTVVLKNSPAFNESERLESVVGGWRVPNSSSHYDKAEYQLELAYGYLNELGMTYDPETEQMALIDAAEMNARTSKALELIKQVIQLDPANASAWAYMAQAHSRNNEIEAMRDSLSRSWALAPNNLQLAPLRLSLVTAIDQSNKDASAMAKPLSADELSSAQLDVAVIHAISPRYLALLAENSETIGLLLGDLKTAENTSS